jgi:signal transduction histidine kinase
MKRRWQTEGDWIYRAEYFRKDGSRVPVLLGAATLEGSRAEGVAFVLDCASGRRRTRESLRRYDETQTALARANRATTMGQLTASIAHEVNRPPAGIIANAEARLRWLDRATPDLDAVRRTLEWIIDDGNRRSEVIQRVRALANQTEIEKVPLDPNDLVREIIVLVQRELIGQQLSSRTELAPALPTDHGRPGPIAAGDYQPGDEWHGSHATGHGSAARTSDSDRVRRRHSISSQV